MPIFRRAPAAGPSNSSASSAAGDALAPARQSAVTVLASGTRLEGKVTGTTEVQIEGEVAGEVRVEAVVVVGAGGVVLGPVHGSVVRVTGQVTGNVTAADRVEVSASGSVEGDIAAPRVMIAEGAFFRGKIEMRSHPNPESRRAAKAAAEAPKTAPAQRSKRAEDAEAGEAGSK